MGTPAGVIFTVEGEDGFTVELDSRASSNAKVFLKWLDEQPPDVRVQRADRILTQLLRNASSSSHPDDKWCVKLCGFVQQSTKSADESLRQWAFTEDVATRLFSFYLDWYEHDSHRSMRLVLDLLVVCITLNPDRETGLAVKERILKTVMVIVARKSTEPLAKSSMQVLNTFLSKNVISLEDVARIYIETETALTTGSPVPELWRHFTARLFSWMESSHVSPTVGKIIVWVFREMRRLSTGQDNEAWSFFSIALWKDWLQDAVVANPESLEDVKNYVLIPILKDDKIIALELLTIFNRTTPLYSLQGEAADSTALLQLAVLELGKKCGLVDEPSDGDNASEPTSTIVLQEAMLESLLRHPSSSIRATAFSLLVSSQATTKPLSERAMTLLKRHFAAYHADYEPKLRNEIIKYSKDLLKRVKNVTAVSKRRLTHPQKSQVGHAHAGDTGEPAFKRRFGPEAALKDESEAVEILERHSAFLGWYLDFLKGDLIPTASYQRRITAAKLTYWVLKSGKEADPSAGSVDPDVLKSISSDPTWLRLILDLILDPFDDVRETATTVLAMFPQDVVAEKRILFSDTPLTLLEVLQEFCDRAHRQATRTGRADHGDGVARSQGLLCSWLSTKDERITLVSNILDRLEDKLSIAEKDLGSAAIENPVHGDFSSIGYVWQVLVQEDYSSSELEVLYQIQRRILKCCTRIWEAVKFVLCDDSPEGYLPEELEETEGLDTKDLLSYSFRAVRESSNLLRRVVDALTLKPRPGVLFPAFDVFRDAGYLSFEQLANLRHRGAFSTVSYTFTTCCQLTLKLEVIDPLLSESKNLLRDWYKGTLLCVENQVSTTRRSAGIPALMTGILAANASSPSFQEVFLTLDEVAAKPARVAETDGSNLPQVHALNCLRGVFRSSLLSKRAEVYLGANLKLAASSLKSGVWAIRNCGLLLFRSLIDTLFGTGESKEDIQSGWDGHTRRISYNNYPALPGVLLGLLKSTEELMDQQAAQTSAAEAVFPVLDIIRRAGPPDENYDELRSYIEEYLGSHLWHVREIAARTLCSFLLRRDWIADVERLIRQAGNRTNRVHGSLLAAKFVLERKLKLTLVDGDGDGGGHDVLSQEANGRNSDDTDRLAAILGRFVLESHAYRSCPEIQATCLDILNLFRSASLPGFDVPGIQSPATTSNTKSALLAKNMSVKVIYDAAESGDITKLLQPYLLHMLDEDVNTACAMLETIPDISNPRLGRKYASELCLLYIQVCRHTEASEPRALALLDFAELVDNCLEHGQLNILPDDASLLELWSLLGRGEINPTLSSSILRMSGPLMAILTSRAVDRIETLNVQLQHWGAMMSDALDADSSFDVRFAAATALKSFAHDLQEISLNQPSFLPFLSALYDALNDDDAEIRDIAAATTAAGSLLGTLMTPFDAAEGLLLWLGEHFDAVAAFRSHVVCRMAGFPCPLPSSKEKTTGVEDDVLPLDWPSAETQLQKAMELDDSLFPVEEQNLFVEEVRETRRWGGVLRTLLPAAGAAPSVRKLRAWTEDGLRYLIRLAERDDGPLGWASDEHVFALCARVILCAATLAQMEMETGGGDRASLLVDLLDQFRVTAIRARCHGSLLAMAVIDL